MDERNHKYALRYVTILGSLLVLTAAGVGLMLGGCGERGVLQENDGSFGQVDFFDLPYDAHVLAKRADVSSVETLSFEARLEADLGGVIALHGNADIASFVVVPGSVLSDTTITVSVSKIEASDGEISIVFDFGPDGLQFSRAAVLRLNVAELFGPGVSSIEFYWLNEETASWECLMSLDADGEGCVYAPVEHFSHYGVGKDSAK